jgi:predicted amidophosphoribosyltransferase
MVTPFNEGVAPDAEARRLLAKHCCKACGSLLGQAALFCGQCGAAVERNCPRCKQPVEMEHIYCPGCGSLLNSSVERARQRGAEKSIFCASCGTQLVEEAVICPKCGVATAKFEKARAKDFVSSGTIAGYYVAAVLFPFLGSIGCIYLFAKGKTGHGLGVLLIGLFSGLIWLSYIANS